MAITYRNGSPGTLVAPRSGGWAVRQQQGQGGATVTAQPRKAQTISPTGFRLPLENYASIPSGQPFARSPQFGMGGGSGGGGSATNRKGGLIGGATGLSGGPVGLSDFGVKYPTSGTVPLNYMPEGLITALATMLGRGDMMPSNGGFGLPTGGGWY